MKAQISPSMMCVPPFEMKKYVNAFEKNKIEYLHIDVMDGSFVPNFTLGTDFVKNLRGLTSIPMDIHLMINRPEDKLDWFDIQPGEYVSIHCESTHHVQRALGRIRDRGAKTMLALNPATPISALDWVLDDLDAVLVMTVNPGFAGQSLIPQALEKITGIRDLLDKAGKSQVEIEVDGNVSFENARKMREAGADIFVAGSSSVFTKEMPLDDAIIKLRKMVL